LLSRKTRTRTKDEKKKKEEEKRKRNCARQRESSVIYTERVEKEF